MKRILAAAATIAALAAAPAAAQVHPYVTFETGIVSRDVVEEDASIAGFSYYGTAISTRALATVGVEFNGIFTVYAQGGAADLAIDEFNGFDGSFGGSFGGGVRVNFLQTPAPYGLKLFVEASMLHLEADDVVQAEFGCTAANGCTALGGRGDYIARMVEEEIDWDEYTLLMGGGSRYGPYAPYGGIRLSVVDAKDTIWAPPDANFSKGYLAEADLKEQDNFGAFFGMDLFLDRAEKTALNFEVSLFDQYSFRAAIRRAF